MADFEIRSLRVSAQMDASQYVAGAAQKSAADKSMVASGQQAAQAIGQVGTAFTETNTKISQAGDVMSRLSRQFVDGYAAAQRATSAQIQLANGIERGKISMEQALPILEGISRKYGVMGDAAIFAARGQMEAAAAVTRLNAKLAEQRNLNPSNQNQGGLARFGAMNAASQFQDIAVTSAMGQSPLTIMLQQGTQLGQALQMEMGDQGAKGLVKGLAGAFASLLSPVNLLAIGLTGVAAVAIEFGSKLLPQIKSVKDATEDQQKAVNDLADAYHNAKVQKDAFYTQSVIAATSEARRSTADLQKSSAAENLSVQQQLGSPFTVGRGRETFYGVRPEFAAFGNAISILNGQIRAGHPDYVAFEKSLNDVVANNPGLETTKDKILGIVAAATAAAAQLKNTADQIKDINRSSVGNFDRTQQAGRDQSVMSQRFGDDPFDRLREQKRQQDIGYAQSQDERGRSLDRTLASTRLDVDLIGEGTAKVEERRMAFQLEGQVREEAARRGIDSEKEFQSIYGAEIALIRQKSEEYGKQIALEQARRDIHGSQDDLELQRAEIALVGQGTLARQAAIEALKTEQHIRELGIPLYGQEAEGLRAATAARNANNEALAKAQAQQQLLFDLRQMGRSEADQSVASQLRSMGFSDTDLDSDIAKVIKMRDEIGRMKDTWNEVFDVARSGIDGVVDALFSGGSIEDALKKAGQQLARTVFDMAVTNPLKNWLTGSNLNTIADLGIFGNGATSGRGGGFGGVLGNLLGAQKAVASMQVQAASVFINGSPIGGIPGIPGLPGAANDNSGPFGWLKSLFGGQSAQPFQTNTTLSDILGYGGQNNAATAAKLLSGLGSPLGAASSLTGSMSQYASAIKAVESLGSGGYSALGPLLKNGNQALGAYQIMKSNLPSWSSQTFGSPMSVSDFMSNPAAQDAIFNKQFGNLLGKYGNPQDAASAWFTGGPLSSGAGKMDILGTSGAQYVNKFNAALSQATQNVGQLGGVSSSALGNLVSSTGQAAGGLNALGSGAGKLGSMLSQFPAAPGGGGGSPFGFLGNIFSSILGGGGLNPAFSGTAAYSFLSANPGGYIGLYADGTESAPPGWAWVGEKGPELKKLRAGDVIRSNPRSMDMMKASGGGAGNDNMKDFVRMLAPHLKTNVKNINIFDPSVVGDYLNTPAGEEVIMNVLRRNNR